MKKIKAIIVDDIPLAISSLSADLEDNCPEIDIVGTAEGVVSSLKLIQEKDVDLVFLDIDLQDGNGFDVLDLLGEKSISVIFTTASKDHAIKAFQYAAIDYLLKPIDPKMLTLAVQKAVQSIPEIGQIEVLKEGKKERGLINKIAVHTQDKIQIILINKIIRLEAEGNYCYIHQLHEKKILVSKTLKEYDALLSPHNFYRVHQSHLVNVNHIKSFVKTDGGYLVMANHEKVPVSVRRKSQILQLLK